MSSAEDTTVMQVREEDRTPSGEYVPHSSLSPPPFSSSGPGPFGTSSSSQANGGAQTAISPHQRALMNDVVQSRVPRRGREHSRPTFPQTGDLLASHVEDAGSSAAGEGGSEGMTDHNGVYHGGDGDGDADADDSIHPPDGEVDGDDRAFVLRTVNGVLPKRMPLQAQSLDQYKFPRHRLPTRMRNDSKIPLVIVACGSFSPPTYLHLRIFEMAKDQVIESGKYELLGGYYSPVSDYYKKEGLAKATHRVRMCELAVEKTSTWLMVDAWESLQGEYQRTAVVLDHFDDEINGGQEGGILTSDGTRRKVRIMLLAGGDLIQSMGEPGVWADVDLHHILGRYGCMIVERTGADVWSFLLSHDLLWRYRKNLKIVKQTIFNDISSSKVRLFVRRGQSIKYLLPNSVIHYIEQHKLYRLPKELDTDPPDADLQHA
jgi:nicotinamide mononucleotide adenylyltransferase